MEDPPVVSTSNAAAVLADAPRGSVVILDRIDLEAGERALLRAMGLRPGVRMRVCRRGEPCIVELECPCGGACRVGLTTATARRLTVRDGAE